MGKSIYEQNFFTRMPNLVAPDLLGKYVCTQDGERYRIVETEAYFHTEKGCYGHGKTKKEVSFACVPLFEKPGTWCVYGGQLILSANAEGISDNVLIKRLKNKNEVILPDLAETLRIYKSKPGYCGCHGQFSLCKESALFLEDDGETPAYTTAPRIRFKDPSPLRFIEKGEDK